MGLPLISFAPVRGLRTSGRDRAAAQERLGETPGAGAVLFQERLGGILRKVDAADAARAVGSAAVEGDAGEDGDGPGGSHDGDARIGAVVAHQVVAGGLAEVLLPPPGTGAGE